MTMTGNTGAAATSEFNRQTHAEYEQRRSRAGSARIRAPIVRFWACKVAWMNCPHRGYRAFAPAVSRADPPALCGSRATTPCTRWRAWQRLGHVGFPVVVLACESSTVPRWAHDANATQPRVRVGNPDPGPLRP